MNYTMKGDYFKTTFAQGICAWHSLLTKVKALPPTMERKDVLESMERAILSINDYVLDGFQKANADLFNCQLSIGKMEVSDYWLERMPPRNASLEVRNTLHGLYHSKELLEESEKFYTQIYRLIVELSGTDRRSEIEEWLDGHEKGEYMSKIYHSYYYDDLWISYTEYTGNDEYV